MWWQGTKWLLVYSCEDQDEIHVFQGKESKCFFKTFVRYKCKCKKWQFCAEQLHTLPAICMRILTHVLLDKILPVGVWVRGVDRKDVRGDEIHPLVG